MRAADAGGRVTVGGRRRCAPATRATRSPHGVAHVPEDRLGTGVAPSLSIAANLVLKAYRDADVSARAVPAPQRASCERAATLIARYAVRAPGPETRAARPLGRQPAEGRDRARVRGRAARARRRRRRRAGSTSARSRTCTRCCAPRRARGVAVLMISEDLDEILALADRVLVMYEGAIVGERRRPTAPTSTSSAC